MDDYESLVVIPNKNRKRIEEELETLNCIGVSLSNSCVKRQKVIENMALEYLSKEEAENSNGTMYQKRNFTLFVISTDLIVILDKCGIQELSDALNSSSSDSFVVPIYTREFILEGSKFVANFENVCFNCGGTGHAVANCSLPYNKEEVSQRRASKGFSNFSRIHESYPSRFTPGILSEKLKRALNIKNESREEPSYYSEIRKYGVPPSFSTGVKRKLILFLFFLSFLSRTCLNSNQHL